MLGDILSMKRRNISSVILYGNMSEQIIGEDYVTRPVIMHIHQMLKNNGFDNIVFYDSTNAQGKFTKDDDSACYCFNHNIQPYIQKYGRLPHGMDENLSSSASASAVPLCDDGFGRPRVAVEPENTQNFQQDNSEIRWSEPNTQLIPFYSEICSFMGNDKFRTCIVIINPFDTISHGSTDFVRRISYNINFDFENSLNRNGNLIIFLQPDISDVNSLTAFMNALTCSSLRDKFMVCSKDGQKWYLDNERCFRLDVPGTDEIERLLIQQRFSGKLEFNEPVPELASRLNYMLREGYERSLENGENIRPTSLSRLSENISRAFESAGRTIEVDTSVLSDFCGYSINFETEPEKKLCETKGWEGVYKGINEEIIKFTALNPEYSENSLNNPSERNSVPTLIPERLSGGMKQYPSADKLPHFAILASPGTGKTTIARLLGRIFFDRNMLKSGHVVCAKGSDIISMFVGGTVNTLNETLKRAEGGILFIDEAYSLYSSPDSQGNNADHKKEAVDFLVQALTDNNRHFILVFAGYPNSKPDSNDGVEALFKMNVGLRSRIKKVIYIKDYSASLLAKITMNTFLGNKAGITVDSEITLKGLEKVWERRIRKRNKKTFGNAREAINYADEIMKNTLLRCKDGGKVICREDFPLDEQELVTGREQSYNDVIESIRKEYPGGLGDIASDIVESIIRRNRSEKNRQEKIKKQSKSIRSMIFAGRPGSGKTTIAKLLPEILGTVGIMSGAEPVVITNPRSCTLEELERKIDEAVTLNTILFIDEAYALTSQHVTNLLSPMTDEKLNLVVVFAIYEKEVENFKKTNDGIASRCDLYHIPDYTPSQLIDIFRRMCLDKGYDYSEDLCEEKDNLGLLFRNWYDTRDIKDEYANARDVENLIYHMAINCEKRVDVNPLESGEGLEYKLTVEDIPDEYNEIIEVSRKNADINNVLAEFDNYYGLDNLKNYIKAIDDKLLVERKMMKFHAGEKRLSLGHFAFVGEAGTGKTTAGAIFARCLFAMGLLKTPSLKTYSAGDLIAGYVGQTMDKTREALEKGRYGVIIIDEAYMLAKSSNSPDNADDKFRQEAVSELLIFLENEMKTGDTIVIFAGYEKPVMDMLNGHEGLLSRVPNIINFPSYSVDECFEIFKLFLKKEEPSYILDSGAEKICRDRISELKALPSFSNARTVRTLVSEVISSQSTRIAGMIRNGREDEITLESYTTILPEDF